MDSFNFNNLKKATAEAGSFFSRAKQFTEEKLGGAEKTFYDANLEMLIRRADSTKGVTERIVANTTCVLQPNPNERLEDFVLTRLDRKQPKPNNLEVLGHCLTDAGLEIGQSFQYGNVLGKVGEAEKKLGYTEKEFVQKSSDGFLQPLKSFLDGQMKTIQREKGGLERKRLDLDACKARVKKLTEGPVKLDQMHLVPKAEDDLRRAQTEFDRQSELTKLLMDELTISYNHHLQCLTDFVDAQLNYYNSCTKILTDLSKQIGGSGLVNNNNNISSNSNNINNSIPKVTIPPLISNSLNSGEPGLSSNLSQKKKAKVLFDYEATDQSEVSVSANQIIDVQIILNDNDWVLAESGRDTGKVPKAYIQIVE